MKVLSSRPSGRRSTLQREAAAATASRPDDAKITKGAAAAGLRLWRGACSRKYTARLVMASMLTASITFVFLGLSSSSLNFEHLSELHFHRRISVSREPREAGHAGTEQSISENALSKLDKFTAGAVQPRREAEKARGGVMQAQGNLTGMGHAGNGNSTAHVRNGSKSAVSLHRKRVRRAPFKDELKKLLANILEESRRQNVSLGEALAYVLRKRRSPSSLSCENVRPSSSRKNITNEWDRGFLEEVLANISVPHADLFSGRITRHDEASGICVAIPTVPRRETNSAESLRVLNLLKLLSERRASSVLRHREENGSIPLNLTADFAPSTGSSAKEEIQIVVYSGYCTDDAESEQENKPEDADQVWSSDEMLLMNSLINEVIQNISIPAQLLTSNSALCDLFWEPERFVKPLSSSTCIGEMSSIDRIVWWSKLALDFTYVMQQCLLTNPRYILLLQDDVEPVYMWDKGVDIFVSKTLQGKEGWPLVSLYNPSTYHWKLAHGQKYMLPCCNQALLFNASLVPDILEYFKDYFVDRPSDLLLQQFMYTRNLTGYIHVPSLFQHLRSKTTRPKNQGTVFHRDSSFQLHVVEDSLKVA